jgi:glycosyltransferase involved in cell wall biosynthesis
VQRERILWITNLPSPYRVPAWQELARHSDLLVAFHDRQHANRPIWKVPTTVAFETTNLRTHLARGQSDSPLTGLLGRGELRRLLGWAPTVVVMTAWGDSASIQAGLRLGAERPRPLLVAYYGSSRATRSTNPFVVAARRRYLRRFGAFATYGTESSELLKADGVDPSIIVTGFNSVDVHAVHDQAAAHRQAGIAAVDGGLALHRFLFAGQLIERKGPDLAVAAMADPRLADCTLSIVGTGPMDEQLRGMVRQLGLQGRVELLGLKDTVDMPKELARHQTLVMPSRAEVWGLVANEALAAGLHAVVSASSGSSRDLARHRGVFLAPTTVQGLADAMVASIGEWRGPISSPEMLGHGACRMAEDIRAAIDLARRPRLPRRGDRS